MTEKTPLGAALERWWRWIVVGAGALVIAVLGTGLAFAYQSDDTSEPDGVQEQMQQMHDQMPGQMGSMDPSRMGQMGDMDQGHMGQMGRDHMGPGQMMQDNQE
jgi:hypothetical protein